MTVAATLAGLVFVAISFAVGAKTERRAGDLNAWVTPSLVYFGEVFVTAGAAVAPLSMVVFGGLILGGLAIGIPFAVWRVRYFLAEHRAESLDVATWMFQIVLPSLSHVAIGGGAALLLAGDRLHPHEITQAIQGAKQVRGSEVHGDPQSRSDE